MFKGTSKVQVRFGSGLDQYRLKFNSFELDSEVGRLVQSLLMINLIDGS